MRGGANNTILDRLLKRMGKMKRESYFLSDFIAAPFNDISLAMLVVAHRSGNRAGIAVFIIAIFIDLMTGSCLMGITLSRIICIIAGRIVSMAI